MLGLHWPCPEKPNLAKYFRHFVQILSPFDPWLKR